MALTPYFTVETYTSLLFWTKVYKKEYIIIAVCVKHFASKPSWFQECLIVQLNWNWINRCYHHLLPKFSYLDIIRKFRMEQSHIWLTASSHIWGNICSFPHILGSHSSYMTLQLLHSEFPYMWGKFSFLFYQCTLYIYVVYGCNALLFY